MLNLREFREFAKEDTTTVILPSDIFVVIHIIVWRNGCIKKVI